MDIFAKKLGERDPQVINAPYGNGDIRPFLLTEEEVMELKYSVVRSFDQICWEGEIITQIWENKYGWFDTSKNLIDIGAGAGEYPIFCGFKHSWAFDPNKRKQALIWANMLSHDKLNDITVYPYGISDEPGIRTFNGWSEDIDNSHPHGDIEEIEFRTLDSFKFENVGLIKIDIEGFEYFALKSGVDTLIRNNYPPLLIEVWSDGNIRGFFEKHGDDVVKEYLSRKYKLLIFLEALGYVRIEDPRFGDWETSFFIHKDQLNGWVKPKE